MNPLSVVVVDDHSLFRAGVISCLERDPAIRVVGEGASGREAVSLCAAGNPLVALIDISMPDDGIAAVGEIAAMKLDTRIIMLTVSENEDDVLRALDAGAVGYVLKGVSGPELVDAVKTVAAGETFVSPNLAVRLVTILAGSKQKRQVDTLSAQETRTLQFVALGMNNRECAAQLGVSEQTVKYHMTNIMKKLGVRNRVEAALVARTEWGSLAAQSLAETADHL
ncbi:MAG: response regulator transcription factor [Rhizobiaceae bacterium]|nr:response regulator transcription factor [Rhizobiaceae bacterium]